MERLVERIIKYPRMAILVFILVILIPVAEISNLQIDSSADGLMVEGDPGREYYEIVKKKFGSDTLTIVVIESKNGDVFTEDSLSLIYRLTEQIRELEGVTNVHSLTTAKLFRLNRGFPSLEKVVAGIPSSPNRLMQIKAEVLRDSTLVDNIVSKDGSIAAINVFTENRLNDSTFNKRICERIEHILDQQNEDHKVYQIGSPLAKVTFSSYIAKDQKTLIPLSVVALFAILLITFRNTLAVVVPLITGGFSIIITLGLMSTLSIPINVITVFVPSILIAVGCTEDVHMLCKFFKELRVGRGKRQAILHMVKKTALPISLTALTTAVGFATLSVNKITILKEFGLITSLALFINFLITIVVVPIFMMFYTNVGKNGDNHVSPVRTSRYMDRFLEGLVKINGNYRSKISVIAAVLLALAIIGCFRLEVNTDFISYFEKQSFIRERVRKIHEDLSGGLTFSIVVDTAKKNGILEYRVNRQIIGLQEYIRELGVFDKVIYPAEYIMKLSDGSTPINLATGTVGLVGQDLLGRIRHELKGFVDDNSSTANIIVKHNLTSSHQLSMGLNKIREYIDENFSEDLSARFTGEGILLNNAADAMVKGQIYSLGMALIVIFIVMSALFSSFRAGVLAMIPNVVPIILNFGLMGWLGIPLNTGTCMVAAIALGIAVDNTIHFTVRYREELRVTNERKLALPNTIRTEGEPILLTSLALFFGFGVLTMSNFNPTKAFGLLSAMVMASALLTDLFVNPIICRYYPFGTRTKEAKAVYTGPPLRGFLDRDQLHRPSPALEAFNLSKPLEPIVNQTWI